MSRMTGSVPLVLVIFVLAACCLLVVPVHAFTSDSLDITIDKNGDAIAQFRFTLEGIIENSIPQSMLESELKKGLTTSSDPPEVLSFDRAGASLLLKSFAVKNDVPTGTEYATASMDFSKAEIALKNSALSYVVSADFSPKRLTVKFPDGYTREFSDASILPSIIHTVVDPSKPRASQSASASGTISVNSVPAGARVSIDSVYIGDTPSTFSAIAPGQHTVSCELLGFLPYSKMVNVTAGNTTTVNAVLSYGTPASTPTTQSASPAPVNATPGFGNIYLIAVLICVVIAVAVAGTVLLYKNSKKQP